MALQLEIEDVKQDLNVRLLKAIGRFDKDRCRSLPAYLYHELQYEILDMRRFHRPHGIVGVPKDERLEFLNLDYINPDGELVEIPTNDNYDLFMHDILQILHEDERTVLLKQMDGYPIRKKSERSLLEKARMKLSDYFPERKAEYA
jgi:DNA-directed RNA polymerase specialized sigma24 family protein